MACAAAHWAAPGGTNHLAVGVGTGSAVAAGLPGHHHRMRCGAVREVTTQDGEKHWKQKIQVSL